jgi:hypothetical protein
MARKHGFRGTPVRPPKGPATIGRVFEQRGDPMVSPREGREKYGRNLETENPDFDRYFAEDAMRRRDVQVLKPSQIAKGTEFRKSQAAPLDVHTRLKALTDKSQKRRITTLYKARSKITNVPEPERDEEVPPDNIPKTVFETDKSPSREKQTPKNVPHKSYIDFSGKEPKKEIIKNGKVYRRK